MGCASASSAGGAIYRLCHAALLQPADMFGEEQNDCNLMLHITTKHVFENFAGGSCQVTSTPGRRPDRQCYTKTCKTDSVTFVPAE